MKHWRDWRNDLLANPRFQAFSARFFLTRGITRKRSADVFNLCAGFVY
jgi:demethylspheroidene O-methyltransferase